MDKRFKRGDLEVITLICRSYKPPRFPGRRGMKALVDYFILGGVDNTFGCPDDNWRDHSCSYYYTCRPCWGDALQKYLISKTYEKDMEIYEVL